MVERRAEIRPHNMDWTDEIKSNAFSPCAYCSGYHETYRLWNKCARRAVNGWVAEWREKYER